MNFKKSVRLFLIICLPGLLSISCRNSKVDGRVVITQAPAGISTQNHLTGEAWRYIPGARILILDPEKPSTAEVLTPDFYSACSPEISWDARIMLFAGQQKENDPWQIWEMDLKSRKVIRITNFDVNCTDPVSLPTGKVIFSKTKGTSNVKGHSLFVCNADGSESQQLTFHPHENFATSILYDGRLISVTRQLFPSLQDPMLMVLRPDGTKADLFYKGRPGITFQGRARESVNGKIFFIESDITAGSRGNLVSVNYNRPLFSRQFYSENIQGSFQAVYPLENNRLLVCYRSGDQDQYALYEFDASKKELGNKVFAADGMNIIDVVEVRTHTRPKKLPSEIDPGVKTGLLLCQDINFTGLGVNEDAFKNKSLSLEVMGVDSSMGIVQVENDGSFYLKVIADKPFQMRRLDNNGNVLSQSAWIWLRPNERRGCIGCHENPELAPDNRVPLSVKKDPVNIPMQVWKIIEKEVELE